MKKHGEERNDPSNKKYFYTPALLPKPIDDHVFDLPALPIKEFNPPSEQVIVEFIVTPKWEPPPSMDKTLQRDPPADHIQSTGTIAD